MSHDIGCITTMKQMYFSINHFPECCGSWRERTVIFPMRSHSPNGEKDMFLMEFCSPFGSRTRIYALGEHYSIRLN